MSERTPFLAVHAAADDLRRRLREPEPIPISALVDAVAGARLSVSVIATEPAQMLTGFLALLGEALTRHARPGQHRAADPRPDRERMVMTIHGLLESAIHGSPAGADRGAYLDARGELDAALARVQALDGCDLGPAVAMLHTSDGDDLDARHPPELGIIVEALDLAAAVSPEPIASFLIDVAGRVRTVRNDVGDIGADLDALRERLADFA